MHRLLIKDFLRAEAKCESFGRILEENNILLSNLNIINQSIPLLEGPYKWGQRFCERISIILLKAEKHLSGTSYKGNFAQEEHDDRQAAGEYGR